jgi:phosphosulfolactate synthase (CoM biosynthesis protein A)
LPGLIFLVSRKAEVIDLAHNHGVYVSTGGWIEHILTSSDVGTAVERYLKKCKDLGFDVVEVSTGFLSLPTTDWVRLVEKVQSVGLKARPELGIQFDAGGDTQAR